MRKRLLFLVVEDTPGEMVMLWQGFFRPRAAPPLFYREHSALMAADEFFGEYFRSCPVAVMNPHAVLREIP